MVEENWGVNHARGARAKSGKKKGGGNDPGNRGKEKQLVKALARGKSKKKANNPGKKRTKSGNDIGRAGNGAETQNHRATGKEKRGE